MSVKDIELLKQTINNGLCNRCGSCVALSEGAIEFCDREGQYIPRIIGELSDDKSKLINQVCTGRHFDFPYYRRKVFGENAQHNPYIGVHRSLFVGYSTDDTIRNVAASGGIISAVLIHLLDREVIDGAIVLRMSKQYPWRCEPFIATNRQEVLEAAQSKYLISSVNEILLKSSEFKGKLAFVGIPGQIQSIRALQDKKHPLVANIKLFIGPFYGNTLHFSSIKSFISSYGVKDYHSISKIDFRYGEWPGNLRVETTDGKVMQLKKFYANYLIPFHIMKNSLLCTDLTNEYTDISCGDAWAPNYEDRGKGFSFIIARSMIGEKILQEMQSEGLIKLESVPLEQAIQMHSHGYDLKKRGAFIRIKLLRILRKPTPAYGYELKNYSSLRILMEIILDTIFVVTTNKFVAKLASYIPPWFIGWCFDRFRVIWKKATYSTKRKGLLFPK